MDKAIQYKTFSFELMEVKEVDSNPDEGIIDGYASTFGNVDQGLDVVEKGAFKVTIKDSKGRIPILADHNPYEQIGWNEQAHEDDKGLAVVGAINLKVQKGVERYALAKQALKLKARAGLSIGYTTIQASPNKDNPRIRHLKELKLWEYSLVTFPMNVESLVTAAKGIGALDKARTLLQQLKDQGISVRDMELALREEANHTDEDPALISQSIDKLIQKFKS